MAAAMAKTPSLLLRAEQSSALELSSDSAASRPKRKRDFVFVVNPMGANGRTGREWKKLLPHLRSRLADHYNICESMTSGPSHAVDITREAIREGAHAVIAVGGDGTLHEVVNGFFWEGSLIQAPDQASGHSTALGLIPLGTGSDFARTFGWKNDPYEAVERLVKGVKSKIDVGSISGGGKEHFFINVADIHLSAKAGFVASKYKRFGNLCYVIGALKAFTEHDNRDLKIRVSGGEWEVFDGVTALCIGNAKFFGGGMKITPTAHPTDGNFEVVILQKFKWHDFVFKLHKLYAGSHLSEKNICTRSVKSIEVEEIIPKGDVYVQSDGEHFGFLPTKFSILPSAIEFFI